MQRPGRNAIKYRYKSVMKSSIFKKSVFISLLGHLTVFGLFSISFGDRLPKLGYGGVNYRGAVLNNFDLAVSLSKGVILAQHLGKGLDSANFKVSVNSLFNKTNTVILEKINKGHVLLQRNYLKPFIAPSFNEAKMAFPEKIAVLSEQPRKKSVLMFYPSLPHYFNLYFKDRQAVHIELMFNIASDGLKNSIEIKRKISSGNLEADLLSIRYISQYLFIRQKGFAHNKWQSVKIDLSAKNDL